MLVCGSIFHNQNYKYNSNSNPLRKFLVLLNTPTKDEPCIVAPVTSQQYGMSKMPGCCNIHSVFFLPERSTCFQDNSWVQLYNIKEIDPTKLQTNNDIVLDNTKKPIDAKTMTDIIDCLFKVAADDLSNFQKKYLKPTIPEGAEKLREFFCKKRNK